MLSVKKRSQCARHCVGCLSIYFFHFTTGLVQSLGHFQDPALGFCPGSGPGPGPGLALFAVPDPDLAFCSVSGPDLSPP